MDDESLQQMLHQQEEQSKAKVDAGEDMAHNRLVNDLQELITEAQLFEFHDFLNKKYAAPKVELHRKLLLLGEKIQNGDYDN